MVQGKTKGLKSKAADTRHAHKLVANPKKGKRTIAPKRPTLIKQAALQKVRYKLVLQHRYEILMFLKELTAKINKSIEQQMVSAASSGKLTIMKNTMPDGYVHSLQAHIDFPHCNPVGHPLPLLRKQKNDWS